MVEWRPLMGILPPLTDSEWQRVYNLYQSSPEYAQINSGIGIDGFKNIFFWEYVHRLLGRLIGIAFTLPLIVFAAFSMIPKGFWGRLIALLMLGGMQGGIGWWMVKSGLVDNPDVSQYRLAIHLSVAVLILGLLIWTALDLIEGKAQRPHGLTALTLGLLGVTIIAGAFVAGLDGGKLYNEYPLMGAGLVPIEYGEGGVVDAFENPASAQFHHRIMGLVMVLAAAMLWHKARQYEGLSFRANVMVMAVIVQFLLGLMTLLYAVPVSLGVLHQAGGGILLMAMTWVAHGLSRLPKM
jgi:cytochrome c oxidase assembly protein subunit 15